MSLSRSLRLSKKHVKINPCQSAEAFETMSLIEKIYQYAKSKLLIISLLPLKPVKSGYQNSVFLLFEFLKKKFDIKFFNVNNENNIDPVLNLNIGSDLNRK